MKITAERRDFLFFMDNKTFLSDNTTAPLCVTAAQARELAALAAAEGFKTFTLDGLAMADKKLLLEHMAARLAFPGDFGKNWDAAIDYLSDLQSFHSGKKFFITVENAAAIEKADAALYAVFMEVLGFGAARTKEAFGDAVTLKVAVAA